MNVEKLSSVIEHLPHHAGLYIGVRGKTLKKRYCIGQPQLRRKSILCFSNSIFDGLAEFGMGDPKFPIMIIDLNH